MVTECYAKYWTVFPLIPHCLGAEVMKRCTSLEGTLTLCMVPPNNAKYEGKLHLKQEHGCNYQSTSAQRRIFVLNTNL